MGEKTPERERVEREDQEYALDLENAE